MSRSLVTPSSFAILAGLAACLAAPASRTVGAQASGGPRVESLRTEYRADPLGIDVRLPRLSWQLASPERAVLQSAYQVRVARNEADLRAGRHLVWDSGRVASGESAHVPYAGPGVESRQRYYWQVQVWDQADHSSGWSTPAWWEMGLLQPADWQAGWIEPGLAATGDVSPPPVMLRRAFSLAKAVRSARAYVTSHGLYELRLNGKRVGDELFTPGWTSYNKRLQYQTYDVTPLLARGANVVGAVVGNGWYRGQIGFRQHRDHYGDHVALLAQIDVTFTDGSRAVIGSDGSWTASRGPILMSEIYAGETYDARRELPGWDAPGYDAKSWSPAKPVDLPRDVLVAPQGPPVRRTEEIHPVNILQSPSGTPIVDMGQNMVGWVRLHVQGPAGATVTLHHGEVLDQHGNLYVANLRAAAQTVTYTLKGGAAETFEPHFTFQGFRYVAVDGYPGTLTSDSLTGVVIHSDMEPTSEFRTSEPLVNQLQHNILWGQKGNFLDVPTDCPQRDERLGWTGDAQVFCRTAAFNMDVAGFFTKWLKDLAADQLPNGSVPYVIPDVLSRPDRLEAGSAAWADSSVIIPWTMYLSYGDRRILAEQYPSMTRWVAYMRARAGDDLVWDGDFHFGDWLAFATTRSDYPGATTGKDLIATAFFAHSTDLVARTARVLGKDGEASQFEDLFTRIKAAFVHEFVTPASRVGENTQTAYAVALQFDLLPESLRAEAASRLAADVRERKHLTTGFVGTPYLLHVLTRFGYLDEAYMLLQRQQYPSWLYPVTKGATTIWERWDGIKADGSFQDPGMNSYNHYAYGAVGEWMYRVMAGLEIDDAHPGYSHILIQPQPGGTFTEVSASHQTPYGRAGSHWTLHEGVFTLDAEVPANTTATVRLPHAQQAAVTESGRAPEGAVGISGIRQEGSDVVIDIGSGRYRFSYPVAR
jgi:alpha-L-rhamnosidase